ncbi:hypothetical protein E5163_10360 [Marinicauda algicola]|uniref:Uncharacterized protein n=1 Tax=Marinicauda algicola TaxID=2029849 RepID=A0A4S2GYH7_9PROT|nr:hypothetical protein [Marinicauda algicola]TGY88225.1 hypothetical protein E5163_10360 [Marinicauda algicola]
MASDEITVEQTPPRFSEADIISRFEFISDQCNEFAKAYNKRHDSNLTFDPLIMLNVVHSTLDDIWRYKVFHLKNPSKKSNCVKRSAYFTKWIVRFKPLYFAHRPLSSNNFKETFNAKDSSLLINEAFAIHYSLSTIRAEVVREEPVGRLMPTAIALASFIYDLRYRLMSEDALMAIYQIYYDQARGIKILKQN